MLVIYKVVCLQFSIVSIYIIKQFCLNQKVFIYLLKVAKMQNISPLACKTKNILINFVKSLGIFILYNNG